MTVRVDALTTDVVAESKQAVGAEDVQAAEWKETAKLQSLRARLLRDEMRTRSSAFDD
jgi:hypothetical protein